MELIARLAQELQVCASQVQAAVELIDGGNTIPFIARYRKEATGGLDDTQLRELLEKLTYLRNLQARKEEVQSLIEGQGALTEVLSAAIAGAQTLSEVEDLYRPYRPKRKTRASVAKERGLQPLADQILAQNPRDPAPLELAKDYCGTQEVPTPQDALQGAMDILAEGVSDDAGVRKMLRGYLMNQGVLATQGTTQEDSVYRLYYDHQEKAAKIAGHRVLAIDRGEREEKLKVSLLCDRDRAVQSIYPHLLRGDSPARDCLKAVCEDAFDRLLFPSLEREVRRTLTEQAQEQAIKLFALNLHHLLLQPPVKGQVVLGLDPAYRTGCKISVVDATGKVLDTTVVYPTPPQKKIQEATRVLKALIEKYHVTVISIGNGTASRESEQFVAQLIKEVDHPVSYLVVSEAGASVYSASKLAAEEFPQYDVSLRSAISSARRLQDPLAELVKIDPKSIGVGQYQHDMPQKQLGEALGGVVEGCVNAVGVDLNTASHALLSYVAGINGTVAKNIVAYREENGAFQDRKELLKVPKLGKKAFQQCAGFLRIPGGKNILDATAVHPESYPAAQQLLDRLGYTLQDVAQGQLSQLGERVQKQGLPHLAQALGVGEPTLRDIVQELQKPGRDPRDQLPKPQLRTDVMTLEDLKPGMVLTGTVRNVMDFGAFVDIGVHEDGLVHISQLCDRFVRHPSQVVKVGDLVQVKVLEVDVPRKRISLSMRDLSQGQL